MATVIFGVLRLGEKDFTDLMNQTIFIRRQLEHEKNPEAKQSLVKALSKSKTPEQVKSLWGKIKLLRNLDLCRLQNEAKNKQSLIVSERDWMIAALLALTQEPVPQPKELASI